ncbi:MAG: hypothetical protein H0X29_01800 [Parachlamydiaceae bacterium]|nr:hypothetical protein [Parachlamydiaceae bacterium]
MTDEHNHPFYGHDIIRRNEQQYIQQLLSKYQHEPVSDELKKKVWDDLQREKHLGRVTIPFRLGVRRDPYGKFPDVIEVILDTKV